MYRYTNEWDIFAFSSCFETAWGQKKEKMGEQLLKPLTTNSTNTTSNHTGGQILLLCVALHMWVYKMEKVIYISQFTRKFYIFKFKKKFLHLFKLPLKSYI